MTCMEQFCLSLRLCDVFQDKNNIFIHLFIFSILFYFYIYWEIQEDQAVL